jgi:hypothetical protein
MGDTSHNLDLWPNVQPGTTGGATREIFPKEKIKRNRRKYGDIAIQVLMLTFLKRAYTKQISDNILVNLALKYPEFKDCTKQDIKKLLHESVGSLEDFLQTNKLTINRL